LLNRAISGTIILFLYMRIWVLILSITFCLTNCKDTAENKSSKDGISQITADNSLAKPLIILDFNGLEPRLSTDSDSTFIVNFWATWCKPCVKELPYFQKLGQEYNSRKVKLLFVSLDFPNKYESLLKPYIKEHNIEEEVIALNDPNSNDWIPKIDDSWTGAIPATIIFNKNQRKFYEQSFTYEELEAELNSILNK